MKRRAIKRRREPTAASTLVDEVLGKWGLRAQVREHRLVTGWEGIVGPRVAARAWPDGLERGVLFVRVANSSWLHELSFLREVIVESANRALGAPPLVREVRLHLGARRDSSEGDLVAELAARRKPKAKPRPRVAPTPAGIALIDVDTAKVANVELREIIRNVRKKIGV